ncbi:paraben-hydrolyzing esterase precursor [Aaosphaeria arxii CBS 175.79]|uniref:Carboxylic ester hydrolase n=1 Tax=Aaosphaeria arxii CBS 175.79 TaxID=1450172 RepID=A0A6A5Y6N6_9PLEO|nr:paraben-hydrolyzing esterase precursor [Aaosphaeria arxii CBS 175.79]KAF2020946.1 paraben-hydrolyzing esterase precursor [Aaosphaeria arxii CBS 175.79]
MRASEPYLRDLQFRGFVEGLTLLDKQSLPLCHYFGGIPYALPPTKQFRWARPRSLPPCFRYGTSASPGKYTGSCGVCPQPQPNEDAWDEDCLQSNIYIPIGDPPQQGWPVLFWIHGGFLQFGNANDSNPMKMLSDTDCKAIIVMPAYRLNVFGFLASPELLNVSSDTSANLGFWDQRLALEWTWQNISYFGGNASNITIGGYSAGSHSTFHQLAYDLGLPDNKCIVRRALMMSNGPGLQPKSLDEAQDQFDELLQALEIPRELSAAEKLLKLRSLDARTLVDATTRIKYHQFRAVTDGSFVRVGLMREIDNGSFASRMKTRGIKLIIGECKDEHNVYGTWRPPSNDIDSLFQRLQADYPTASCKALMRHYYPGGKLPTDCQDWKQAFGCIYADIQIHHLERGMVNALVRHGAGHLIYRYRIEWRAACCDRRWPKDWGVTHGTDMVLWFWGDGDSLNKAEQQLIRAAFHDNLAKFIKGEEVEWGTQHPLHIRTLKANGSVKCEEDRWLEEGLKVWDILKEVGTTRQTVAARL